MAISKFLTISGFGLLVLCFAISVCRVVRHGRKHSDPEKFIVRYAHHIQEESVEAALRAIASAYERDHLGVFIEEVVIPKSIYRSWVQTKLVGNMATDLILLDTVPAREQIMFHFVNLNAFMDKPNPYNRGTKLEDMTWRETFMDHLIGPRPTGTASDHIGEYPSGQILPGSSTTVTCCAASPKRRCSHELYRIYCTVRKSLGLLRAERGGHLPHRGGGAGFTVHPSADSKPDSPPCASL